MARPDKGIQQRILPVSRAYAKAAFLTAREQSSLQSVGAELHDLMDLFEASGELSAVLLSDAFSKHEKRTVLQSVLSEAKASPLLQKLLLIMLNKGRLSLLTQIVQAFDQLCDEDAGILRGTVVTSTHVSDGEIKELESAFERRFKKRVTLRAMIDNSILGGLIVQVAGLTFDGSLRTSIQRLRDNLERQSL